MAIVQGGLHWVYGISKEVLNQVYGIFTIFNVTLKFRYLVYSNVVHFWYKVCKSCVWLEKFAIMNLLGFIRYVMYLVSKMSGYEVVDIVD